MPGDIQTVVALCDMIFFPACSTLFQDVRPSNTLFLVCSPERGGLQRDGIANKVEQAGTASASN